MGKSIMKPFFILISFTMNLMVTLLLPLEMLIQQIISGGMIKRITLLAGGGASVWFLIRYPNAARIVLVVLGVLVVAVSVYMTVDYQGGIKEILSEKKASARCVMSETNRFKEMDQKTAQKEFERLMAEGCVQDIKKLGEIAREYSMFVNNTKKV